MTDVRKETDSLGIVEVAADKLWGAQTQRSLEHFIIETDLIPREMITAYAILKKAAAAANHDSKRLDNERYKLIVQTCDEILAGRHHDMVPLHLCHSRNDRPPARRGHAVCGFDPDGSCCRPSSASGRPRAIAAGYAEPH